MREKIAEKDMNLKQAIDEFRAISEEIKGYAQGF